MHLQLSLPLALGALSLTNSVAAFYLPGVAPTSYKIGDRVPLNVNRLTPAQRDSTVRSVLSFNYYHDSFHFCRPKGGPKDVSESLGSILFGDRIQTSPFELRMGKNETCKTIPTCGPQSYSKEDALFVNTRIYQGFNLNWLIDGLPAAQPMIDHDTEQEFYAPGFALGQVDPDLNEVWMNNHYDILIDYHEAGTDKYRVVGILVAPSSTASSRDLGDGQGDCPSSEHDLPVLLSEDGGNEEVVFTYSVYWVPSPTPFATRWDKYLHVFAPRIHWLSLINSAVIVIFLSAMIFSILMRLLRKDIRRYNKLDSYALDDMSSANGNGHLTDDDVQEDSGWKLIHGDVFRPPNRPLLLSVLVGNGAQLFFMTLFTIAFALLGFLSPSNRGSLGSIMILLYTFFGFIGGFVSSYTYNALLAGDVANDRWRHNIILTPVALPALVFATFFSLNFFLWIKQSSGAVPFTTMLAILAIWFLISLPLSFLGSYLAFRRPAPEPPVRTNQIPRQIPDAAFSGTSSGLASWLNRPIPAMLLTGILPFGAIFVELYFIMESIWSAKIFYMFGFLFVCFALMVVTCATVTVLSVYFCLCAENYHWQWRSFATSGACAIYVFLNAIGFWIGRLSFGSLTGAVLYLAYSALISGLVFVLTGTIGFFASWLFVSRIYRSIKVD